MKKPPPQFRPSLTLPAVPIGLLRSCLFPAGSPDDHGTIVYVCKRPMPMAAYRGEKLAYRGPPINQQHAIAWQAVLLAAAVKNAMDGKAFVVSPDFLLRQMGGKGGDRSQRQRLTRWLNDLTHARIDYSTRLLRYKGPLIATATRAPDGRLILALDPQLRHILRNEVLRNDLARKARLGLNSLAMWLHDYIATHLRPPPEPVDRLRKLSGSILQLPQFRARLRAAIARLKEGPDPLIIIGGIDQFDRLVIEEKAPTDVVILEAEGATSRCEPKTVAKRKKKAKRTPAYGPNPVRL